jgi:hypothetical protein
MYFLKSLAPISSANAGTEVICRAAAGKLYDSAPRDLNDLSLSTKTISLLLLLLGKLICS